MITRVMFIVICLNFGCAEYEPGYNPDKNSNTNEPAYKLIRDSVTIQDGKQFNHYRVLVDNVEVYDTFMVHQVQSLR